MRLYLSRTGDITVYGGTADDAIGPDLRVSSPRTEAVSLAERRIVPHDLPGDVRREAERTDAFWGQHHPDSARERRPVAGRHTDTCRSNAYGPTMVTVEFPWSRGGAESGDDPDDTDAADRHADAVVVCEFQDGTIAVYETEVVFERPERSRFGGKTIPVVEIVGVEHDPGITVGYLQIRQEGVEVDTAGLLSDPVDENTLHFTRSGRECAQRARDAVLERIESTTPP